MEYAIAALKESNKILAFDLEKTRLWAIAAEEELEQAKEEIRKIKEHMHTLIAEKDKAVADLAVSEAEKAILLEIVNTS